MKAHTTYHHVIPRSRGGNGNGNIVEIPETFHVAWHIIFENLYGEECVYFIEMVNKMMEDCTSKNLAELREKIKKR